jgi:predicted dehydrogenase
MGLELGLAQGGLDPNKLFGKRIKTSGGAMEILHVGIVGSGVMGALFARLVTELPHTRVAGAVDVNLERAEALGREHDALAFRDTHGLLEEVPVDAVIVATGEDEHLEPVRAVAQAGKPVLVEKPLASSVAEGKAIIREVTDADVPLMVAHCVRFDRRYASARSSIQAGEIGEVIQMSAWRKSPLAAGQRLAGRCPLSMFLGVHDIDFMLWAIGREVKHVFAAGQQGLLKEFGVYDSVVSVLVFDNGALATLELSWAASTLLWQFSALGTKGTTLVITPELSSITHTPEAYRSPVTLYDFNPLRGGQTPSVYKTELMHFFDCISSDRPFLVQPTEALRAVSVAEAIDRSLESGKVEAPEAVVPT